MSIISDRTMYNNLNNNGQEVQEQITYLINQISSGKKASSYLELHKETGSVAKYAKLEEDRRITENLQKNNECLKDRINTMISSMDDIIDFTENLKNSLTKRFSAINKPNFLKDYIKNNYLPDIANALNANLEGRFLFSGTSTNTLPVANLNKASNVINGVATANYYQGNDEISSTFINEEHLISYGVTADNQIFQTLIASANKIMEADQNNDIEGLKALGDELNQSISDLVSLKSNLAMKDKAVESNNKMLSTHLQDIKQTLQNDIEVDIPAVTAELFKVQNIWQALGRVYGIMKNLSLAEYL